MPLGFEMIRGEVVEAFERCRSKNIPLPAIEQFIHEQGSSEPFIDIEAALADRKPEAKSYALDIPAIALDMVRHRLTEQS